MSTDFLLTEKYRPTNLSDCILPSGVKKSINAYIEKQECSHFLFHGPAGCGKTTVARIIAKKLDADLMYINASNENGVDTIRNKISQFASTVSFESNLKIILLDEADFLTIPAQAIMRSTMEQFMSSTRFILTCNHRNKIMDAIESRCVSIDFSVNSSEHKELLAQSFKRVVDILRKESIEFDINSVGALVKKYFPDLRKVLNEIQRYSIHGKIDSGVLVESNTTLDELIGFMKAKKLTDVRKWIARNPDLDHQELFNYFYNNLDTLFTPTSISNVILVLGDYQHRSTSVRNQEINTAACLVEFGGDAEWK